MPRDFEVQGLFQYKDHLFRYMIPIIMVRQSWDCLIFIIGISRLVRWHHYIETAPRLVRKLIEKFRGLHHGREHSLACHRFISSCWPVVEKYQPEGFTFCVMIFSFIFLWHHWLNLVFHGNWNVLGSMATNLIFSQSHWQTLISPWVLPGVHIYPNLKRFINKTGLYLNN